MIVHLSDFILHLIGAFRAACLSLDLSAWMDLAYEEGDHLSGSPGC